MRSNQAARRLMKAALLTVLALSLSWSASLASSKPSSPPTPSSDLGPGFVHQTALTDSEFLELSFPIEYRWQVGGYKSHVDHSVPGGFYGNGPPPTPGYNDSHFTAYTSESGNVPLGDCGPVSDGRTFCYDGHAGLDILTPLSTTVYAATSGQVVDIYTGCNVNNSNCYYNGHAYGNFVAIRSVYNTGYYTLYGHNSTVMVHASDFITRGQLIAYSGQTGDVTGPHVHFGFERSDYHEAAPNVLDPYGWFSYDQDPYNTGTDDILRFAGGYAPASNSSTDPENWNQGTVIGNVRLDKDRNKPYGQNFQVGDAPTSLYSADPIEAWWTNHYGAAGAPDGNPYDSIPGSNPSDVGTAGRCQNFEGGTYCAGNNTYQNAIINNVQLSDVPLEPTGVQSYWAHRYIMWAFREHIVNGYPDCTGTNPKECPFRPDNPVIRGQLAVILTQAGVPLITGHSQDFCDVVPGDWDYDVIETMANTDVGGGLHIMDGTGVACGGGMTYFNPNGNVRREEAAKAIIRYGTLRHWVQANVTTGYPDYVDIGNSVLKDFIESLYNYGIIQHR
jgi:murein DD-endopeptidase MepM/ murein hydrolase activator NlpD